MFPNQAGRSFSLPDDLAIDFVFDVIIHESDHMMSQTGELMDILEDAFSQLPGADDEDIGAVISPAAAALEIGFSGGVSNPSEDEVEEQNQAGYLIFVVVTEIEDAQGFGSVGEDHGTEGEVDQVKGGIGTAEVIESKE